MYVKSDRSASRRPPSRRPSPRRPSLPQPPSNLAVGESFVIWLTSPSPSLLKHLLQEEGGAAEWQNSRRRLLEPVVSLTHHAARRPLLPPHAAVRSGLHVTTQKGHTIRGDTGHLMIMDAHCTKIRGDQGYLVRGQSMFWGLHTSRRVLPWRSSAAVEL